MARTSNSEKLRRVQGVMPGPLVDKILNASKHIEGERRTVTILFSDVVGFTSISEKLDPETVYNIIDASVSAFRDEIYLHEGTLDKFMGDGVMALFGAPVMHEDDPTRAVRCALGMQAALKRINDEMVTRHGITLQMRIGLNLGTVVVADIGADLRMNYTALGDTVNVASRLQSVAEPGTILVSRAVYEQTRAMFDYSELGSIRVKGRVEPVEIYQVIGAKREPGRARGIPGLVAPMVGRNQELARVQHSVELLARDERGGIILVTGEAGIGKTRLTSELKQWVARTPELVEVGVYEGNCVAYGKSAYDVQIQILSALLKVTPDDPIAVRREKIKSRVRSLLQGQALFDVLPYIEMLLGVPPSERESADRLKHLEPAQLRQQTFLAVRELFVHAARANPLILIFEDLHWVDKPSLDMLLFLFPIVEDSPLLLLCLARPHDNQAVPQIQRLATATLEEQFTQIALEPLSVQDSTALISELLSIAEMPDSLRQMIPQRSEGNPFYLEEILRAMIDRNILRRRNERWEVTPGADVQSFAIPRTLESLIMTRMDHLSESTRYTAQCAAVIGRDFSDNILRRIADTSSQRLDNDLQELIDHEIALPLLFAAEKEGNESLRAERQFAFRHILIQQIIYNSVLLRRREQLHHKIAAAIEEIYPDRLDEQSERLAFHYLESKDAARALPHVIRSAERAAARFANEEALTSYRTALDLANRVQASAETRTRILIGLGDSQTHIGDFDGATSSLRAAWDLARSAPAGPAQARQTAEIARRIGRGYERRANYDDAILWLESALREINRDLSSGNAVERVRIYLDIGWVDYRRGNWGDAEHWRLRALEISEGLDYYAEMGSAFNGLAALYNMRGDRLRAIEFAERGLQVREMVGDVEGMSRSHSNIGATMLNLGRWDDALPHLERSLELKRRIGDAKNLPAAYTNLGHYYLYKGDTIKARELLSTARRQAERLRDTTMLSYILNALAFADLLDDAWYAAAGHLELALSKAKESGAVEALLESQWMLAETKLKLGDRELARRFAGEALEGAQSHGLKQAEASALRSLGSVERALGNYPAAESHLLRSLTLFNDLQNPFDTARAELEIGQLFCERDLTDQARQYLETSRATFEELGASRYIGHANAALYALA